MRVKDPFDDLQIDARKVVTYALCAMLLAIGYAIFFPAQVALIAMVLTFPLMIFLHELGHFVMAKRADMKVTEFFVGFGPRLWSVQKGETEYGIKAIPFGGYCRVIGMTNLEEVAPEDEERAYRAKPWGSKVSMAAAGPAVHFMIAIVLMFTVLFFSGDYRGSYVTTKLAGVSQGAQAAGLQPGDTIVAINGTKVTKWAQVPKLIAGPSSKPAQPGDHIDVVVRRGENVFPATVTLQESTDAGPRRVVAGLKATAVVPHPGLLTSIAQAPRQVYEVGWDSVKALGSMFSPSGIANYYHILAGDTGKNVDQNKRFLSPVGFAQVADNAVRSGWVDALGLLIAINVFVGLLNLVPLLPFDGGHIAVATYERIMSSIRRRKVQVDVAKLLPITVAVVAVLGFIFVSSLFLDLTHPVANPF